MKNVPELRFPEFIEEWEEKRLGDLYKYQQGQQIPVENQYKIQINNMKRFIRIVDVTENPKKRYIKDRKESGLINQKDLIMIRYGASAGTISMGYEGVIANNLFKFVKKQNVDNRYFYFLLKKSHFKIKSLSSQSAMPALNFNAMDTLKFSIPQYSEQQKIGSFFSKLDRQIELEEQKLEKLEEQKKGYMQQIFSQQLRFKDENGDYYSEWKEKLIKDILEFENNRRKPITSSLREIGKYPYYGATGIIDYVKDYIFDGETRLLIGEDGAKWGAFEESSFIAKNRYWVNNHAHVCKSKINNLVFLNYLLNYKELRTYVTGNAPAKLTYNNLSMIPMFLPSVYEQEKIGNFLKKIDELIGKQNKKINELKIRKQGFLQKMFI